MTRFTIPLIFVFAVTTMKTIAVSMFGLFGFFLSLAVAVAAEPNPIPQEALQEMEYRVGEWESQTFIDGVEQPGTGHELAKWAGGGKYCVNVTATDIEHGEARGAAAVVGWDPDKKQLVERWHVSDGLFLSYQYRIDKEMNCWIGTFSYADTKGQKYEGQSLVTKKGQDEWVWEASWSEDGKQRTRGTVNRRVKKVQVTHYEKLKELAFLVGEWEGKRNNGGTARWTLNWTEDKNVIQNVITMTGPDGNLQFRNVGIFCWDPDSRRLANVCVTDKGKQVTFLWAKRDDGKWETWLPGSQYLEVVTIVDDNTWKMEGDDSLVVFKRIDR